jgi:hypothetical protein
VIEDIRLHPEVEMNSPVVPRQEPDHTRAVILSVTIIALTCILSCAAVLITLILRAI